MVKRRQVSTRHSAEMAALHHTGMSIKDICQLFSQYSVRSVHRHAKKPIGEDNPSDQRRQNPGRPAKLSDHDRRSILRTIKRLRQTEGSSFTSKRILVEAGLVGRVSCRTVRRFLNKSGYRYLQSRKKGLLKQSDLVRRVKFSRKVRRRNLRTAFWTHGISFYLDAKGFEYKTNPNDQARAPPACQWRKRNEGLEIGRTAKGRKEGVTNVNFMVAISFNKGVVLCERYHGAITAEKMVNIVDEKFEDAFNASVNPRAKRFLMDNCPRQTSRKAYQAYDRVHAKVFRIPPRSPDLNPIENFFHLVSKKLKRDALEKNITYESKTDYATRVRNTMMEYPTETIDNIIESMDRRIGEVLRVRGQRIRY